MKKTFLLAILMIGYYLPSFSQSPDSLKNDQLQLGTNYRDSIFKNSIKTFGIGDSIEVKGMFKDFLNDEKLGYYKLLEEHPGYYQNTPGIFKQPQAIDNMPVYKPKENFLIPTYEPDSTISYTLLIKED